MPLFRRVLKTVTKTVKQVTDTVTTITDPVVDLAGDTVDAVMTPLVKPVEALLEPLEDPLAGLVDPLAEGVGELLDAVADGLGDPLAGTAEGLSDGLAPLTGALDPLTGVLDPLLKPVTDGLNQITPTNLVTTGGVFILGTVVRDLINDLGIEDELGPVVELLHPVDELVGALDLTPLYDGLNALLAELVDPLNDVLDTVRDLLPDPLEELIDDLPALGVIGETERTVFFIPYEEGGLLSDLDDDVLAQLGLTHLGANVDAINEALAPLRDVDIVGDLLGGTGFGVAGIIPVPTQGQLGLGVLLDTVDIAV